MFEIGIVSLHFLNPMLKQGISMGLRTEGAKANVEKAQLHNLQFFLKLTVQAFAYFGGILPTPSLQISCMTGKSAL